MEQRNDWFVHRPSSPDELDVTLLLAVSKVIVFQLHIHCRLSMMLKRGSWIRSRTDLLI